jgi:hypothetical protein
LLWFAFAPSVRLAQKPQNHAAFDKSIQPFLAQNCYACHNAQLKSGNLNLEKYQTAAARYAAPGEGPIRDGHALDRR